MTDDKAARLTAIRAANNSTPVATPSTDPDLDNLPPAMALHTLVLMLLAVVVGALAAVVVLPTWLPALGVSLLGPEPKAYWYLARASALVAYALLWLAMALGLLMTNRLARLWPGGPVAFDLHQHASLLGLAFALFHALILMGDAYIHYSLAQVLIPFAGADYKPIAVGLGQVAFYLLAVVGLSFYVRQFLGRRGWRLIHVLSFAVFALALAHGIWSGTDSGTSWAQALYWASGGSLLFLTIYRILITLPRIDRMAAEARLVREPENSAHPTGNVKREA